MVPERGLARRGSLEGAALNKGRGSGSEGRGGRQRWRGGGQRTGHSLCRGAQPTLCDTGPCAVYPASNGGGGRSGSRTGRGRHRHRAARTQPTALFPPCLEQRRAAGSAYREPAGARPGDVCKLPGYLYRHKHFFSFSGPEAMRGLRAEAVALQHGLNAQTPPMLECPGPQTPPMLECPGPQTPPMRL